ADIGRRPPGKTIGRIDNDLGYLVDNVEWQTYEEQAQDTRNVHRIQRPDGRKVSRAQFSRELGLPAGRLKNLMGTAKRGIARGVPPVEIATKLGIQLVFWLLLAGMLKGPDDHNAPVRAFLLPLRNAARQK